MDWNSRYRVTRGLVLYVADDGDLFAGTGRGGAKLALDAVAVLGAFARPLTVTAAHAKLAARFDFDREGFESVVDELLASGALTVATAWDTIVGASELAGLEDSYLTLRDARRTQSYQVAIERAVPGKVVVEIGAGVGVLSTIAAKAGAKKVYAIESGPLAEIAREVAAANGVADRVTVIRGSSFDVELPEPADVLIHDLVTTSPIGDLVLPMIENARRLLAPDARIIPYRFDLSFIGIDPLRPEDQVDELGPIDDIAAVLGVDLAPLITRLRRARPLAPQPRTFGPLVIRQVITHEAPFVSLDLRRSLPEQLPSAPVEVILAVHTRGRIAGVAGLFRAHLDDRTVVGNHPWVEPASWGVAWHGFPRARGMVVLPNDRIAFTAAIAREPRGMRVAVEIG